MVGKYIVLQAKMFENVTFDNDCFADVELKKWLLESEGIWANTGIVVSER